MKPNRPDKTLGLALGGGGARGLVHVQVLQVLEEYGIRPKMISGASIGAIIGAFYCSGHSAELIRNYVDRHLRFNGGIQHWKEDSLKMMEMVRFLDLDFSGTGIIKGERFTQFLDEMLEGETFDELEIPLKVVATNYWEAAQVVFDHGPIPIAVKASMSVPGVFSPVVHEGMVLVDGACTNPVPWDLLEGCDIIIGVNALGRSSPPKNNKPHRAGRAVLETFDIIQRGILAEKYRLSPPDLLLDPPIRGVGLLDFHKAESVYRQSAPVIAELREFLEKTF